MKKLARPSMLVALLLSCGPVSEPHPATLKPEPPRVPQPLQNSPLCAPDSTAIGIWAADCQVRCLPSLRPPILCHDVEPDPHVVLTAPPSSDWAMGADLRACESLSWRIYRLRPEDRPVDALDMNVGSSWLVDRADLCANKPATFDANYFAHNTGLYYRTTEVIPTE